MLKQLNQVLEFHKTFKAFISKKPTAEIPPEIKQARIKLIREETDELIQAIEHGDLAEIAHETADVLYVVFGTVISFGLQDKMETVFDKIHQSNLLKMSKKGKFKLSKDKAKILKGEAYQKPDLASILK